MLMMRLFSHHDESYCSDAPAASGVERYVARLPPLPRHGSFMRVAIVNVATGPYTALWLNLLPQIERFAFPDDDVTVHLLTDDPSVAARATCERVKIQAHEVPPYRWPDATLRRYEMMAEAPELIGTDLIMYLDVDMQIVRTIGRDLKPQAWHSGLAFAAHPGYFRPSGLGGAATRLMHARSLASDIRSRLLVGAPPGAWETRPESQAFVPSAERRTYVHGAVWMGLTDPLLTMCQILAARTNLDREAGIMATWHDESHLNWYYANHSISLLPQGYSCVDGWWQTRGIPAAVVSVQKEDGFRWQ